MYGFFFSFVVTCCTLISDFGDNQVKGDAPSWAFCMFYSMVVILCYLVLLVVEESEVLQENNIRQL